MDTEPHEKQAFASLRQRNFSLYLGGQLVSVSCQWMQIVAISLLVLDRTGSGAAVGTVVLLQQLPMLVLTPWAGARLERLNKFRVVMGTQILQGLLAGVLALAAGLDALSVRAIYGYALAFGIVQIFDNPTRRVFVFELVGPRRITGAVALNNAVMTSARMIGPVLGGLLISATGTTWCLVANALSYGVIIVALLLMRRTELFLDEVSAENASAGTMSGLRYVIRAPAVRLPLAMTAIVSLLLQNYPVVIPLLAESPGDADPQAVGLLFGSLGFGSLVMAFVVARLSRANQVIVCVAAIVYGVTAIVTALAPGLLGLALILIALGAADQAFSTTAIATLHLNTEPRFRTRVIALYSAFFMGLSGLSGLGVGVLSDAIGPRSALLWEGSAAAVIAAAAMYLTRTRR